MKTDEMPSPIGRVNLLILFMGCWCSLPVVAANTDYTEMSLKELMELQVFTSASLMPSQENKAPGTVYSFTRTDFQRYGVRRLEDLMAFVPGIQINQYRKRHKAIWARGVLDRYNDKLVLLVDGVRVQHLYYGHFSLGDNLPLEQVEKVEFILGPASSLYGANAFAGIISVTTRHLSHQPQLELTVEAADNNRSKATVLAEYGNYQLLLSHLTQDAPYAEDRISFIGGDVLQPLDEEFTSVSFKAQPAEGLTFKIDYNRADTPFLFIPDTQDSFIEQRSLITSVSYDVGDLDSGRLESRFFYQKDKALEYEIEQNTRRLGYKELQNADIAGINLTSLRRFGAHTLAAGISWQHEKTGEMNYTRYFRYDVGFYATAESGNLLSHDSIVNDDYALLLQDVWQLAPNLELTLGVRHDQFDQFGQYNNGRAALVYTPDDQQTFKIMTGTAIRTPSLREYVKVLEGTAFVPPMPKAEKIRSMELGYAYQWEDASLHINLYSNRIKDFILESPTPDGQDEYFTNLVDDFNIRGIEVLGQWQPTEKWYVRVGVGHVQANSKNVDKFPFVADWNASFTLNYHINQQWQLGLANVYNSGRDDLNNYSKDNPSQFILTNVFVSGAIAPNLELSAGVDNAFDQHVYDPAADFGNQYNPERSEREAWLKLTWRPEF